MSRARHALFAWALLLTLVASWYSAVVLPLNERRVATAERLESLVERMAQVTRLLKEQDKLSSDIRGLKQRLATVQSRYVTAPALSVATATLQQIATRAITASGARQTSIRPLPPENEGTFTRLSLSAQVEGSYASIHALLDELEHGLPRIFVTELSLQIRDVTTRRLQRHLNARLETTEADAANVTARLKMVAYTAQE